MKTKNENAGNRLGLINAAQWNELSHAQRLEECQRAQLQARNAEALLREALTRIALAQATLNPR